jgi:hypothetical protein
MFRLFKSFRNGSFDKNGTKKYAIYAVGEIFLVVVGILIALQINNWNEYNKNHALAVKYLKDVQADLKQDTTVFSSTLTSIEQLKEFKEWGLRRESFDGFDDRYLESLISSRYFNIQSNDQAFQRMNDPNVMNIVEFDSLFSAINVYYTFNQDYLNSFNDWDKESSMKESDFWLLQGAYEINLAAPQDSIPMSQEPETRRQLFEDRILTVEGRNYIKMSHLRISTMEGIYQRQLETAKDLLESIEKAIESNS